jgi:hypothetical protein
MTLNRPPTHHSFPAQQEVKSMGSQLAYSYSINRMSTKPFRTILFTSFNARLRRRIELISTGSWERWPRTRFTENSLHDLVKQHRGHKDQEDVPFKGQDLVYLTADAEEELETLKESETYIIGGIVDRNRYKVSPATLPLCKVRRQPPPSSLDSEPLSRQSSRTRNTHGKIAHRHLPSRDADSKSPNGQPGDSGPALLD